MNVLLRAALPLAWALIAASAHSAGPAGAAPPASTDGEVIVRFKAGAETTRMHALAADARTETVQAVLDNRAQALGARVGRALAAGAPVGERTQVVRAQGVDAATLARQLAADPEVEFAVPNARKRRLVAPNDPLYAAAATGVRASGPDSGQWYLRKPDATLKSAIDIETAWARTRGSTSVVVAVLDTGVRFDHPDLGRWANGGKLLPGYDFVSDSSLANDGDGRDADPSDPGDWVTAAEANAVGGLFYHCGATDSAGRYIGESSSWHGTSTASLVGALTDNGVGMAGAAPNVLVQPVRVLGKCFGYDADIQAAMLWAAGISVPGVPDNPTPAKVINMSLGGSGSCTAGYQSVVDQIVAKGVTIVAAAGNSAGGPVGEPANCRGVVGVLALRHAGTKVGFSDLGPEIAIAAPGGNCVNTTAGSPCLYPILAASNSGAQGPANATYTDSFNVTVGTSFSTPLVAGVAALVASRQPQITAAQMRSLLQSTARPFPTSGADNGPGDPTPVTPCTAPQNGVQQLQCYCSSALCGAGMLDAGAAVAAAAVPAGWVVAAIASTTAAPTAGAELAFSAAGSLAPSGASLSYAWQLLNGGGIATGFTSATNADTAKLTPSGPGTLWVRVTVTDGLSSASADLGVTVAAAAGGGGGSGSGGGSNGGGGGGGGGAMSAAWLALLALAVAALRAAPGASTAARRRA